MPRIRSNDSLVDSPATSRKYCINITRPSVLTLTVSITTCVHGRCSGPLTREAPFDNTWADLVRGSRTEFEVHIFVFASMPNPCVSAFQEKNGSPFLVKGTIFLPDLETRLRHRDSGPTTIVMIFRCLRATQICSLCLRHLRRGHYEPVPVSSINRFVR